MRGDIEGRVTTKDGVFEVRRQTLPRPWPTWRMYPWGSTRKQRRASDRGLAKALKKERLRI